MQKIGLLSDTYTCWDEKFADYFSGCDEIWHAGHNSMQSKQTKTDPASPV
jgi:hypothetical protein